MCWQKIKLLEVINMNKSFANYGELPLMLNADEVANVLSISRANAYALMHSRDFPVLRLGRRLLVPRDNLISWIQANTNKEVS